MPQEAHVAQWKMRADMLIAETTIAHAHLAAALPGFRTASNNYARALSGYIAASAREDEQRALSELGRRAGRRAVQMVERQRISQQSAETAEELFFIHYAIYMTQFLIGLGKLAEMGLSIAGTVKSLKVAVEQMKLIVDGAKSVQPVAAEVVAAATGGASNATPWNAALASGQIAAVLLRMNVDFVQWGKTLTDLIGTIRRAQNMRDRSTAVEALAQLTKTIFDQLKSLITFIEGSNTSGMAGAAGNVAAAMSVFRDGVAALRAFMAMYDEFRAMKRSMESMELQIAEGNRYLGNGQQALSNVAQFGALAPERIDDIMGQVHDLQTARVLADRSRREAERLATAMAAAATLRRVNMSQYRSALNGIEPRLRAAAQLLDRSSLMIFDMEHVAAGKGINRGPTDMAEARLIAERLVRQRDLLRDVVQHYRQPAQSH